MINEIVLFFMGIIPIIILIIKVILWGIFGVLLFGFIGMFITMVDYIFISTINEKRNINYSDVQSLLMDIKTQKLKLEFTHKDSLVSINLKNKQNGALCGSDCSDCTIYGLTFTFFYKSR